MALKAVHVTDVPNLDNNASLSLYPSPSSRGAGNGSTTEPNFMLIGHNGNGMNELQSSDLRMKAVKENTILSFNTAAKNPIDFVEFDVQVTKDGIPVIFHDIFIFSKYNGTIYEKRVTELSLSEFLSYGPQRESNSKGKPLLRKTKDGKIVNREVESDHPACTLQEAFQEVKPSIGFNIELKFDHHIVYQSEYLNCVLQAVLQVVFQHAKERPVIFSTFQPDAALLVKKLQNTYPVFYLTKGGNEIYYDVRRNSLEEAIKLCIEGGLSRKLGLFLEIRLLNVPEAVYMQHLMGVDGVIVDFVQDITEAFTKMLKPCEEGVEKEILFGKVEVMGRKPQFSQNELAFLLKLIPELIQ
ncbi:Glycerophosphodiester phosphodiesterase GDPD1-chloroplastic [Striga hermonthica]|uniref:glycerophosphodiester phosphodiesterase n=1 Tax=Striga hermonthica TaxID=68872 RepID=A0A9N7R4I0_STRHE|nr:Glycerophosphodiester phosphodiesterase GDPD1-chloroplastic [Striga hermonthica]